MKVIVRRNGGGGGGELEIMGTNLFYENVLGMIHLSNTNG